jgi:hypothetical protein
MDDLLILVEDCLVKELPSGGFDGELSEMVGHQVRYVAVVFAGME